VPRRASGVKMVGMADMGAPITLDEVAVHPDCWCTVLSSFCTRKSRRQQNVPSIGNVKKACTQTDSPGGSTGLELESVCMIALL